jgi:hypothetical protein
VRLACVKHAASVRSEPGSNSQVHLRRSVSFSENEQDPVSRSRLLGFERNHPHKRICNALKIYIADTPTQTPTQTIEQNLSPVQIIQRNPIPSNTHVMNSKDAANVSLPSLCNCQRAPGQNPVGKPERPNPMGQNPWGKTPSRPSEPGGSSSGGAF